MTKLFLLIPKKPGISEDRFHAHWREVHAPLGTKIAAMRHYVQTHRIPLTAVGTRPSPYEGVAEDWFETADAALGLVNDPDYTDFALVDEPKFIDLDGLGMVFVFAEEPDVVIGEGGVDHTPNPHKVETKLLFMAKRRDGVGEDEFQKAWRAHGERLAQMWPAPARFQQNFTVTGPDGTPAAYDCIDELWFAGTAPFQSAWGSQAVQSALRDIDGVIDLDASFTLVGEERQVL